MRSRLKAAYFYVPSAVDASSKASMRSEAASNIWQQRNILADTRPDLTIAERNQIIKAFDLESFRVNTLSSPVNEFRYFDGLDGGVGQNGRRATPQWFDVAFLFVDTLIRCRK